MPQKKTVFPETKILINKKECFFFRGPFNTLIDGKSFDVRLTLYEITVLFH